MCTDWCLAQLADALGVSRQTINAIETGEYDPIKSTPGSSRKGARVWKACGKLSESSNWNEHTKQ